MRISDVIAQLRQYAPIFAENVAGSAGYNRGVSDQVWLQTPAAYVVPLEEDATENTDKGTGLRQWVTERVGVIIQLDNTADRRSQSSAEQLDVFKAAVFAALLNWHVEPKRSAQGLYYGGGEIMGSDRGRFFYQYTFCLRANIDQTDGFQITGTPLVLFDKKYTDPATGKTLVEQHVTPPSQI